MKAYVRQSSQVSELMCLILTFKQDSWEAHQSEDSYKTTAKISSQMPTHKLFKMQLLTMLTTHLSSHKLLWQTS